MTHALARVATEFHTGSDGRGRSVIRELRAGWPFMPRCTPGSAPEPLATWANPDRSTVTVHLAAGGAGPIGGDQLVLDVEVGAESALVLGEVAPTLVLPGPRGEESGVKADVHVRRDGTLAWLPQLVIAAQGCRQRTEIVVTLEARARLIVREQVLFGRHGEAPGDFRQWLRVARERRTLYSQELTVGPTAVGWSGPAVTAGYRCAGTLVIVDSGLPCLDSGPGESNAAVMELPGPTVVVSVLADDTTELSRRLDAALFRLLGKLEFV